MNVFSLEFLFKNEHNINIKSHQTQKNDFKIIQNIPKYKCCWTFILCILGYQNLNEMKNFFNIHATVQYEMNS